MLYLALVEHLKHRSFSSRSGCDVRFFLHLAIGSSEKARKPAETKGINVADAMVLPLQRLGLVAVCFLHSAALDPFEPGRAVCFCIFFLCLSWLYHGFLGVQP